MAGVSLSVNAINGPLIWRVDRDADGLVQVYLDHERGHFHLINLTRSEALGLLDALDDALNECECEPDQKCPCAWCKSRSRA